MGLPCGLRSNFLWATNGLAWALFRADEGQQQHTRTRQQATAAGVCSQAFVLQLAGVALVIAYMGFGLTQVFFSHNSGNLFYLFMLALLHGALPKPAPASRPA